MAYREPLKSSRSLAMFAPAAVVARVDKAIEGGQKVEIEHSSFSDPGPDTSRVLIDGAQVFTIPGY